MSLSIIITLIRSINNTCQTRRQRNEVDDGNATADNFADDGDDDDDSGDAADDDDDSGDETVGAGFMGEINKSCENV